jgi:hypothetical protein
MKTMFGSSSGSCCLAPLLVRDRIVRSLSRGLNSSAALKLDKPVVHVEPAQDKIKIERYVPLHPSLLG